MEVKCHLMLDGVEFEHLKNILDHARSHYSECSEKDKEFAETLFYKLGEFT